MRKQGDKSNDNKRKLFSYIKKIKLHARIDTKPSQGKAKDINTQ